MKTPLRAYLERFQFGGLLSAFVYGLQHARQALLECFHFIFLLRDFLLVFTKITLPSTKAYNGGISPKEDNLLLDISGKENGRSIVAEINILE